MKELCTVGYGVIDYIDQRPFVGGSAVAVACNAARLGVKSGIVALFGDDANSKIAQETLVSAGVDISMTETLPDIQLTENYIDHSDRTAGWCDYGVQSHIHELPIHYDQIGQYRITHLASAHYALVHTVVRFGKPTEVVSYSPGPKVISDSQYMDKDALRQTDVLFMNENEWFATRQLFGVGDISEMHSYGPPIIVVTRSDRGVTVSQSNALGKSHYKVEQEFSVESTGAGDSFALGFLIGFIHRLSLNRSVQLGNEFARVVIKQFGALLNDENVKKLQIMLEQEYGIHG